MSAAVPEKKRREPKIRDSGVSEMRWVSCICRSAVRVAMERFEETDEVFATGIGFPILRPEFVMERAMPKRQLPRSRALYLSQEKTASERIKSFNQWNRWLFLGSGEMRNLARLPASLHFNRGRQAVPLVPAGEEETTAKWWKSLRRRGVLQREHRQYETIRGEFRQ